MVRPVVTTLALALLSACAVGPDYVRPNVETPAQFVRAPVAVEAVATSASDAREFWHRANDPLLDSLVDDALRNNRDLQAAFATLEHARALAGEARFDLLPTVTANANANRARLSRDQAAGGDRDVRNRDLQAGASWELDLFGRVRRTVEAHRADAWAAAADLDALQVSLVGELVSTYVELRGAQARLAVARENADTQRETLRLVHARLDAGRDTDFDLSRVRGQFEATQARVPALEALEGAAMHRLAVLTGRTPDTLVSTLSAPHAIPQLASSPDGDTPADVLRRRPDVVAAEHRLRAATARIGVATADLFPRLTLGGLLGTQSFSASGLFDAGSGTRLMALGMDWSFLDIGRVRARIRAADADADAALAHYQQAVLLALEDTETALLSQRSTQAEAEALGRAADDATRAAGLARLRFDAGAAGLLEVLDAERTRLAAEDALADARARAANSGVAVYRALAGGWPEHPVTPIRTAAR